MLIDGDKLIEWLYKASDEIQNTPPGDDEYYEGLLDGRNEAYIEMMAVLESFKVEKCAES